MSTTETTTLRRAPATVTSGNPQLAYAPGMTNKV
jgi:hypothetical protein